MPETSREFVVVLPDDNQFTVPVQPSLQAQDLLDMAGSHCKIKERHYFGLMIEEEGYRNWLELDKTVLDPSQEIPKGTEPVRVYLSFKYYTDSYKDLQDYATVELLYLHSRRSIEKGDIQTDEDTVFELAALVMQATSGPFTTEEEAIKVLQALPVIPAYIFQQQSIKACEGEVINYYRLSEKLSRGEAIFKYLEIVQSLSMYSFHYFEVKDKGNVPLWLGVGPAGIIQCPHDNKASPSSHYQWLDLQNIYYKDKKFSVEVYGSNKTSRKGGVASSVSMQSWYGKNSKVVMAIWRMVRDQHIFYRNKRVTKVNDFILEDDQKIGMSTSEILRHLNHKHHHGSISPSSSHSSLSIESAKSNQTTATVEAIAAAKKAQQEMYTALLTKREMLVEELESKYTSYKDLLLKEMQITGVPPEGLTAEEIEKMRTKFSINFKFSKFVLDKNSDSMHGGEIDELEKQLEVQTAIIEAQRSLLDQAKNRQMKKDRKKEVKMAEEKYQIIEDRLLDLKRCQQRRTYGDARFDSPGFSLPPPHSISSVNPKHSTRHSSPNSSMLLDDSYVAKMIFDDSNHQISPLVLNQKSPMHKSASSSLQDVTEIRRPLPLSPKLTPGVRKHLSGTQSLAYSSPQGIAMYDSNRSSFSGIHHNESHHDSNVLREHSRYSHGSTSMPTFNAGSGSSNNQMGHSEDYRVPFNPTSVSNSPNGTPYHHQTSSDSSSGIMFQTHATINIPHQHPIGHRNSSPENLYSPGTNYRASYNSSRGGTFSPEPHQSYNFQNQISSPRSRPQSTHSKGTPPPSSAGPINDQFHNQRNSRGISFKDKEMDLAEALMMDQDEGTLV